MSRSRRLVVIVVAAVVMVGGLAAMSVLSDRDLEAKTSAVEARVDERFVGIDVPALKTAYELDRLDRLGGDDQAVVAFPPLPDVGAPLVSVMFTEGAQALDATYRVDAWGESTCLVVHVDGGPPTTHRTSCT